MAEKVALIDYGAGNLHSVHSALIAAGAGNIEVTNDPDIIGRADRVVLPGVGAFKHSKENLSATPGLIEAMDARVRGDGVPFLGICVGMQLLADEGVEHGTTAGLGWISGTVRAIKRDDSAVKIPHMGWNEISVRGGHAILSDGEGYFLHGFHFEANDDAEIIAVTDHGGPLVAAVGRDNILGVQFHPEKSQGYGIASLQKFLEWKP